jgi:type I restriction-modification system DNA methylase subunit
MSMELYSEQDAESKVIVPMLKKLGYEEADKSKSVNLRFQYPIPIQQGRERKTIRADVVVFVHGSPVIIVDSKNPRHYLTDNDREQVISYARLIENIAPYAALCNGHTWQVFNSYSKQQIRGIPPYTDLIKDIQTQRLTPRQRESIVSQARRTLFAIDSARELSRIMRRCHDVIRNLKGYDPTKAFDELSKMLFAKMYEEREIADGHRLANRFTSQSVKDMRKEGVEIIQVLWRDTVTSDRYKEVFSDQDADTGIDLPPEAIDKIVSIIEDKSLGLTDLDVKGVAFEEFLASTYRGGGLGQYFTPREVVNFMVDLVDPAIGDKMIDPSCGTGGFLIRSYDVVSEKIRNSDFSKQRKDELLKELANSCLVGIDWESRAARTCKMNMIIHGDGHAGVYQANALDRNEIATKVRNRQKFYPSAPDVGEGTFDIVLTNPPFGARDKLPSILNSYELGGRTGQKREVLLLERCIRLLKPGGRMAVVIPEGILSNKNDRTIRDYIRRECIIKAVIRLPQDAFKMSEGAACTSILYVIKKNPDDPSTQEQGDIFFARAEYVGISPSGKPILQNDLLAIKDHYRNFILNNWDGIELKAVGENRVEIIRDAPAPKENLWLEPVVNRTSLLYDRLSFVLRSPVIEDRFSYTFNHPSYYQIISKLEAMETPLATLESLCVEGFPRRGKTPFEESNDGISILKVRNVTGQGIDTDTEFAPDTDEIKQYCARAIVNKNDILITSTGEGTIGRIEIWAFDDIAIADSHVTICRIKPDVNLKFVVEFLRSELGQIQILRHVSGSTGQTELLVDHVAKLRIPLPDEEIQNEIVTMMENAKNEASSLADDSQKLRNQSSNVIASARNQMLQFISQKKKTG